MTKPTNDADLFREVRTGRGKREHKKIKPSILLLIELSPQTKLPK